MRYILSLLLFSTLAIPLAHAEDGCGNWDDVPDDYSEIVNTVCESGLIQGYNASTFGIDADMLRAEAAVIGGRLVDTDYEETAESWDYDNLWDLLARNRFTDTPPNETWNEWILHAMYTADSYNIMDGDGSSRPTTFRPTDTITGPELMKVFFEAAKQADPEIMYDSLQNKNVSYSGDPWYEEIVDLYEDQNVLNDADSDSFSLRYELADGSSKTQGYYYDTEFTRLDAAVLIYLMLQEEMLLPL